MVTEKPWRADLILRLFLGIFASLSISFVIVEGLRSGQGDKMSSGMSLLVFFVGTFAFQGVSVVLIDRFLKEHGVGWSEGFGLRSEHVSQVIGLGLLSGVGVLPLTWLLNKASMELMLALGWKPEVQEAVKALESTADGWERVSFIVVAVGLAPFVEEALFRGILYPAFKNRWHRRGAMWFTAALFAASHFNRMAFIPLTFLAVVLTLTYEATGNLFSPIIAHSIFNAVNTIFVLLSGKGPG